jgi:hypothetical protein
LEEKFAASLLFGNTKSMFGIPQVQASEKQTNLFPGIGTFYSFQSHTFKGMGFKSALDSTLNGAFNSAV